MSDATPALSRERWEVLEPVLDAALALSGDAREQFLERTCSGDPAMRRELSELLASCERADNTDDVLATPAAHRFASLWDDADALSQLESALRDHYTFEGEAGRGGMAVVYRVRELRHGRRVALKVLDTAVSNPGAERFRREIALAASLQHPHVVAVFDSGESAGRLWYTMPFIEGESLGAKLRREPRVEIGEAVHLLREIADALDYAHARGVVHRDLKPDNVLLSGRHAVIADFGVAKAIGRDHASANALDASASHDIFMIGELSTHATVVVGTPAYMAPEQIVADSAVDHRADLYALGVIAYQLLSGAPPFTGASREALFAAHLAEQPVLPSARRSDVPAALERLVMSLLQKRPGDRPPSAAAVLSELDTIARRAEIDRLQPAARRVLVRPLDNASDDPSLDYFGRLSANWIADNLAKTQFVDVASDVDAQSAAIASTAAASQARLVLTGSYFVDGDSIRAQLRIHDVATGTLLPGSSLVSAPRATPSALLGPLGGQALVMLATRLDPRIAEWSMGAPPESMDAYLAFIDGLDQISAGNLGEAIAQWERAASLDSTYMQPLLHAAAVLSGPFPARAAPFLERVERRRAMLTSGDRAWLAAVRANVDGRTLGLVEASREIAREEPGAQLPHFFIGMGSVRVHRPRAALAAAKHVNYNAGRFRLPWASQLIFYVITEAHHQLGEHDAELAAAQTAAALHPNNRELACMSLRAFAARGDMASIESALPKIEATSPYPNGRPLANLLLTIAGELAYHGHPADAERLIRRTLVWQQTRPIESTPTGNATFELARTFYYLGQYDDARAMLDSVMRTESENPFYLAYAAASAAKAGDPAAAAELRQRLDLLERAFDQGETPYARALVAAQLGETTHAIALLRQSLQRGMPPDMVSIHTDLTLSPLWSNAEFQQLLLPKD